MRTKKLLVIAAIFAAGVASTMAQVYSQNVVGYINLTLTNGYNLVCNQLDLDGTGTNNTIYTSIGTNVPNLTRVYAYNPGTTAYSFVTYNSGSTTWVGAGLAAVNAALNPGGGVFVNIPVSASYPQTVTLVGNVKQGTLTTPVATAYQIIGSQVPQSGGIQTTLSYAPVNLDRVYQWQAASGIQGYGSAHTYSSGSGLWAAGEPNVAVGEAFWLLGHTGSTWSRSFTVQ